MAFRTIEYHLSDNSSNDDDDFELLTIKFKKFMKQELKDKNKFKKKLSKKKKALKVTWDEISASKDEEQTDEDEVTNLSLMTLDNKVNNSNKTPLPYFEIT